MLVRLLCETGGNNAQAARILQMDCEAIHKKTKAVRHLPEVGRVALWRGGGPVDRFPRADGSAGAAGQAMTGFNDLLYRNSVGALRARTKPPGSARTIARKTVGPRRTIGEHVRHRLGKPNGSVVLTNPSPDSFTNGSGNG